MASTTNIVPSKELLATTLPSVEIQSKHHGLHEWLHTCITGSFDLLALEDEVFSTQCKESQLPVSTVATLEAFAAILQIALTAVILRTTSGQLPSIIVEVKRGTTTYVYSAIYVLAIEALLKSIRDSEAIHDGDHLRLTTTLLCLQLKTKRRLNEMSRISQELSQAALENTIMSVK